METGPAPNPADGSSHLSNQVVVGWREIVAFPDWGIRHIRAKVDTGARTSALDVVSYQIHSDPDRGLIAVLRLVLNRRRPTRIKVVRAPVLGMVVVANSGGQRESRPVVETTIRLGPCSKRIRLTITNRASMRFRLLMGRNALDPEFLVDVSKQYLLRNK